MPNNTRKFITLLACVSFSLLIAGAIGTAYSSQMSTEAEPQAALNTISGKVTDVIESAGYTYAEVDTGNMKVWAATTTTSINIGDTISFSTSMPMKNYHSKSLNREFPLVYFANRFDTGATSMKSGATATASPHEMISHHQTTRPIKKFSQGKRRQHHCRTLRGKGQIQRKDYSRSRPGNQIHQQCHGQKLASHQRQQHTGRPDHNH